MSTMIMAAASSNANGKGKGKAIDKIASGPIPPMPNPSAGSANPSASLASLWNYLEPALDHIVRSPTNSPERAPAIDVAYHMGIHTAVYNYFTSVGRFGVDALAAPPPDSKKNNGSGPAPSSPSIPHGADLYEKLDKYYSEVCQELLASAPVDDASLLHYLLPCFKRYQSGASAVHRLLNYINRHYVKRAVEEDRGWLRLADILDAVAQAIEENRPREHLAARLRERRITELARWGYTEGSSPEALTRAEAAAEAASPPDRVVPLSSMAHRRFREEVVKPLLAVPKAKKGKKKYKKPPGAVSTDGEGVGPIPKSRLARAVKELVESKDTGTLDDRMKMAAEAYDMLGTVGIPVDHVLRKKLDKFSLQPQG